MPLWKYLVQVPCRTHVLQNNEKEVGVEDVAHVRDPCHPPRFDREKRCRVTVVAQPCNAVLQVAASHSLPLQVFRGRRQVDHGKELLRVCK